MDDRLLKMITSYLRTPYQGEDDFFKSNPMVGGMASEDNRIVMNPYSRLGENERNSVMMNELARIFMRRMPPSFSLTNEQNSMLNNDPYYSKASKIDRASTIAGRAFSGDPTAGATTNEQNMFLARLKQMMYGNFGH